MSRKEKASEFGLDANSSHRSYMFTVWFDRHDQTFEKVKEKMQALYDGGFIRYACLSQELCPETSRLHGHLFTRFIDSWSGVKAFSVYGIESGGGWFEEARKDYPSYEYVSCSGHFAEGQKSGKPRPIDFFEVGERPKSQGISKKKDFAACFAMLQEGRPLLEVCAAFPEIALKGFTNLQKLSQAIEGEKNHELRRKKLEGISSQSVERSPLQSQDEASATAERFASLPSFEDFRASYRQ